MQYKNVLDQPRRNSPTNDERPNYSASKRLLIFDMGFRRITGHHFNNALSVLAAAPSSGFEIKLLSGDTLAVPSNMSSNVLPFFRTDLYEGFTVFEQSVNYDSWVSINIKFMLDLLKIPADLLEESDLILVPAVTQFHIWALCVWVKDIFLRTTNAKIYIQLMFSPTWTSWDAICEQGPQMYREAIDLVRHHLDHRVLLGSEFPASALEYQSLLRTPVHILPHPVFWGDEPVTARSEAGDKSVAIGFFGYSKREKGFHLLPDIITLVRESLGASMPRFVIQINHDGYDTEIIRAADKLRSLAAADVLLVEGPLPAERYQELLEKMDIVLLPYDPALYKGRGSGVFSEAASLGKIIVAPADAGVGQELVAGRAVGVSFGVYTPECIALALEDSVARFETLQTQAFELAQAWRVNNSGSGYLRRLREVIDA